MDLVRIHCSCGEVSVALPREVAEEQRKRATYPDHFWRLRTVKTPK